MPKGILDLPYTLNKVSCYYKSSLVKCLQFIRQIKYYLYQNSFNIFT